MSNDSSSRQVFRVTIFGQTLNIASSTSPEEFHRIADQIDQLMSMIASKSGTTDGTRVGVLTAMHLADRLHQMERRAEAVAAESRQRAAEATVAEARAAEWEAKLEAAGRSMEQATAELQLLRDALAEATRQNAAQVAELAVARGNTVALQAELSSLQQRLKETQGALEAERARIGRDADRLHSLLEEALEPSATATYSATSLPPAPRRGSPDAAVGVPIPADSPKTGSLFALDEFGAKPGGSN